MINKIRALGDTRWDDNSAARNLLRAYRDKNNVLAAVIMERPNYEEMTPHEMLAKIKHHEILDDEAIEAENHQSQELNNNKCVALKANQEQGTSQERKKKVYNKSSSVEEDEDSDEEAAFIIRNFRRIMRKKMYKKNYGDRSKRNKKRFCYNCGDDGHFIAKCPKEKKKNKYNKDDEKKNRRKKRGEAHIGEEWYSNDDSSNDEKNKGNKEKERGTTNIAIRKTSLSHSILRTK